MPVKTKRKTSRNRLRTRPESQATKRLPDIPEEWPDGMTGDIDKATDIVSDYVEKIHPIPSEVPGRRTLRLWATLWEDGSSFGNSLLQIEEQVNPAEAIDFCGHVAKAVNTYRAANQSPASTTGKPSAGSKVYVLALGDGDRQSDGTYIGQYGEHVERVVVIHPDRVEQFGRDLMSWLQTVPYAVDMTEQMQTPD